MSALQIAMNRLRFSRVTGAIRANVDSSDVDVVKIAVPANKSGDAMPFKPVSIAWQNIKYTVKVGKGKQQQDKVLLNGINGVCRPGTLIALMGATGAGKTTLLDVLAQRKATGVVEGDILINGAKLSRSDFK